MRSNKITSLKYRFLDRLHESLNFVIVFVGVFIAGMGLLNYKVFVIEFQLMFGKEQTLGKEIFIVQSDIRAPKQSMSLTDFNESVGKQVKLFEYDLDEYLDNKITDYKLEFNTYVPGKRLVIDSINVDAPVVDIKAASQEKLDNGSFDEELTRGVVKYPFTNNPGEFGNALIFGHSSVDSRKDKKTNEWGYVFYKLPKLVDGDLITMYRDGQMYKYEVDKKVIKRPKQVAEELSEYNDNRYLTLMACYPLLSDAKRILVRAKQLQSGSELAKN